MTYEYKTRGTCSKKITLEVEDNRIVSCRFEGGCQGNLAGMSEMVKGMDADEVIKKLSGIRCGFKPTSCPDQLAKALSEMKEIQQTAE